MKVRAKITFAGNADENDSSGFVQAGTVLDVTPNRANELLSVGLADEMPATPASPAPAPITAPLAPLSPLPKDVKTNV